MKSLQKLLQKIGSGFMESVAYDTAWLAQLSLVYPEFSSAFDWLRENQHEDGSWGSPALYYHDRFICTLNAIIALAQTGQADDQQRVARGINFLWREYAALISDPYDTIAFPVLASSLIQQAVDLGLNIPTNPQLDSAEVAYKLKTLGENTRRWRHHTMSFSLEACREYINGEIDFLEDNGAVGTSPAATAAILCLYEQPEAFAYLQRLVESQGDGGLPDSNPIDIFETAWVLDYLRVGNVINPQDPGVQRHLANLWSVWSPKHGASYSSYFSVPDLDDTALAFTVLYWGGYPVELDAFKAFEDDNGFYCFPHEAKPSISSTLHMLGALKVAAAEQNPAVPKLMNQIQDFKRKGKFWFDKWHASPYYLALPIVEGLSGFDDHTVKERMHWLTVNQRENGGWGYYQQTTAEETAYALLALMRWAEAGNAVPRSILDRGAEYLASTRGTRHIPLWIGKCLYTPTYVIEAAVTAALHKYQQQPM